MLEGLASGANNSLNDMNGPKANQMPPGELAKLKSGRTVNIYLGTPGDEYIIIESAFVSLLCHYSGYCTKVLGSDGTTRLAIPLRDRNIILFIYRWMLAGEQNSPIKGALPFEALKLPDLISLYRHCIFLDYGSLMEKTTDRLEFKLKQVFPTVDQLRDILAFNPAPKFADTAIHAIARLVFRPICFDLSPFLRFVHANDGVEKALDNAVGQLRATQLSAAQKLMRPEYHRPRQLQNANSKDLRQGTSNSMIDVPAPNASMPLDTRKIDAIPYKIHRRTRRPRRKPLQVEPTPAIEKAVQNSQPVGSQPVPSRMSEGAPTSSKVFRPRHNRPFNRKNNVHIVQVANNRPVVKDQSSGLAIQSQRVRPENVEKSNTVVFQVRNNRPPAVKDQGNGPAVREQRNKLAVNGQRNKPAVNIQKRRPVVNGQSNRAVASGQSNKPIINGQSNMPAVKHQVDESAVKAQSNTVGVKDQSRSQRRPRSQRYAPPRPRKLVETIGNGEGITTSSREESSPLISQ